MKIIESNVPLVVAPDELIDINEWRQSSDVLKTEGAQQCMIITARNEATCLSQMGHFTEISPLIAGADRDGQASFASFMRNLPLLGPADATELLLDAGSNYPDGKHYPRADLDREFVESEVGLLIAQRLIVEHSVTIEWQTDGTSSAILDCGNGVYIRHWQPNYAAPSTFMSNYVI